MAKIIAMEEKVRVVLDYYIELLEKFLGNVEEMKYDELNFIRSFSSFISTQTGMRERLYDFIEEMERLK